MNCQQARHLFDTYLDGTLSPGLATELGAHRLQCPSCRRELALMEVAGQVIAADREPGEVPADFTNRLLACLDRPRPAPPVASWRRWAVPLAAAAAVTLAVWVSWRPTPQVAGTRVVAPHPRSASQATSRDGMSATQIADAVRTLQGRVEQSWSKTRASVSALGNVGRSAIDRLLDDLGVDAVNGAGGREPSRADAPGGPSSTDQQKTDDASAVEGRDDVEDIDDEHPPGR